VRTDRREFLKSGLALAAVPLLHDAVASSQSRVPRNKKLGSIFNRDIDGLLYSSSGAATSATEYKRMVLALLDDKPGVLAKNVGMPDPVTYRTQIMHRISLLVWCLVHKIVCTKTGQILLVGAES